MSGGPSKRPRVAYRTQKDAYELVYWAGAPGRGEFIRLAFEEAGVPYTDVTRIIPRAESQGPVLSLTQDPEYIGDHENHPPFACPVLRHGDLLISQTANILLYLGPRLALAPTFDSKTDPGGLYRINALASTALDCLATEVDATHNPVSFLSYYVDQKPEAKRRASEYISDRLPRVLKYFERVLKGDASSGGQWLHRNHLSYADLVLFHGIDGVTHAFPKTLAKMRESDDYTRVFALYERVKARPNVVKYLASDRRHPYTKGIYRYYPELEED